MNTRLFGDINISSFIIYYLSLFLRIKHYKFKKKKNYHHIFKKTVNLLLLYIIIYKNYI